MKIKKQEKLYEFIKHGDKEHRRWLKEAIHCFFNGDSLPIERTEEDLEKISGETFTILSKKLSHAIIKSLTEEPETWTFNNWSFCRKGKFNDLTFLLPDGYGFNLYNVKDGSGKKFRYFEWGHGLRVSKVASKMKTIMEGTTREKEIEEVLDAL